MGVLLASGLIVGESLFGVFTAAVIVSSRNSAAAGTIATIAVMTATTAMIRQTMIQIPTIATRKPPFR